MWAGVRGAVEGAEEAEEVVVDVFGGMPTVSIVGSET